MNMPFDTLSAYYNTLREVQLGVAVVRHLQNDIAHHLGGASMRLICEIGKGDDGKTKSRGFSQSISSLQDEFKARVKVLMEPVDEQIKQLQVEHTHKARLMLEPEMASAENHQKLLALKENLKSAQTALEEMHERAVNQVIAASQPFLRAQMK